MRNVIGTAPSMLGLTSTAAASFSPAVVLAKAGTYAAAKLAAIPLPLVKRNLRRVGSGGRDCVSSSDIGPPLGLICLLNFQLLFTPTAATSNTSLIEQSFAGEKYSTTRPALDARKRRQSTLRPQLTQRA